MADPANRIAVSTWSLHRLLGTTYPHDLSTDAISDGEDTYGEGEESLLGLPSVLANHGYHRLEIVSFHLRSRDPIYLAELRNQLDVSGVTLQTLLIDAGDIIVHIFRPEVREFYQLEKMWMPSDALARVREGAPSQH